jgi:hypothetical protein
MQPDLFHQVLICPLPKPSHLPLVNSSKPIGPRADLVGADADFLRQIFTERKQRRRNPPFQPGEKVRRQEFASE